MTSGVACLVGWLYTETAFLHLTRGMSLPGNVSSKVGIFKQIFTKDLLCARNYPCPTVLSTAGLASDVVG